MTTKIKAKAVAFEVVELWRNNSYEPYTLVPESEDSVKNYAIKIGDYFFLLGDYNEKRVLYKNGRKRNSCGLSRRVR